MSNDLCLEKLADTPSAPGVYLMKDAAGRIIYVGKAGNLKKRLGSYFIDKKRLDVKTGLLMEKMVFFETIVTHTEKEALLLESNLIKQHQPHYNVILKDDKRYPVLRLDVKNQAFPALEIVRRIKSDGALYFGPFTSAGAVRRTLKIIEKTFKLRNCRQRQFKKRERPCLNYQMNLCLAPCSRDIAPADYQDVVKEVTLFLKGRRAELLDKIKTEMETAAQRQNYEQAAVLRDKLFSLQAILEKQVITTATPTDRDVVGLAENTRFTVLAVLHVRGGALRGTGLYPFDRVLSPAEEIVGSFLRQFYEKHPLVPDEVLTGVLPADRDLLAETLRLLKGRKVTITCPQRGEKVRLVTLAQQNAEEALKDRTAMTEANRQALDRLQKKLKTATALSRIECFDISHLSGTGAVSAMAVFQDGHPAPREYRRYNIRQAVTGDDYDCLREVLRRRFKDAPQTPPYPDLLLVDGGKGQLGIARAVLEELGLTGRFGLAAISKKDEARQETADKIYLPGRANPVPFQADEPALFLLQHIRDEAHRGAVSQQRRRRKKTGLASALDAVNGIGQKRKKMLLEKFGTIQAISRAEAEELAALPGITRAMAEEIKKALPAAT